MSAAIAQRVNEGLASGVAVFASPDTLTPLQDALQRLRRPLATLTAGGPAEAMQWLSTHAPAEVVIVDISGLAHPLHALSEVSQRCGPNVAIVAVGDRQDVGLYRQILQAGFFDYLVKPASLDAIAQVLNRADEGLPLGMNGTARAGQTIAVTGAGGGCGVSTLVAALGQVFAQEQHMPIVLVDFDRDKGDLPLMLALEADHGLANALAAQEIDPRLLHRSLLSQPAAPGAQQRLHLLAQRPERDAQVQVDPEQVLALGGALSHLFSVSLWDLPSHRPTGALDVLQQSEIRVIVTELTVQHARHVLTLLSDIGDESAGQRLLVVANAARSPGATVITAQQFADFIGRPIDVQLPFAGNALAGSLLEGPLRIAKAPEYAQRVRELADLILGRPAAKVEPTGLVGYLQRIVNKRDARLPA